MFWWYDPNLQRVFSTRPWTGYGAELGYFEVWPRLTAGWWTPWGYSESLV